MTSARAGLETGLSVRFGTSGDPRGGEKKKERKIGKERDLERARFRVVEKYGRVTSQGKLPLLEEV